MSILQRCLIRSLSRIAIALAVATQAVTQGYAEVRPWAADYSSIRGQGTPTQRIARHFRPGGRAYSIRGVLLDSSALFFMERGSSQTPVAAASLSIEMDAAGRVFLAHGTGRYRMEVHTGISCPLGRFVRRNGAVAYSITVPPRYEAAVRAEGMVSGRNIGGYTEWIPREFSGSPFLDLLYQTDLAQGVEDLPENVSAAMLANVNRAIGRMPRSIESFEAVDGTYLNTDSLVPYRVFLVAGANRVDVSGVPLRYYWAEGADGSLVVFDVKVFSQQFSQRGISDLAGGQEPTHYDVIVFYQTAAVFRELNRANPARFAQFVTRACATR